MMSNKGSINEIRFEDMLTLHEYQAKARLTAIFPGHDRIDSIEGLAYVTMGLVGEAGEIANKAKKIIRDQNGVISQDNRIALAAELGDVLWYVALLADQLDYNLEKVARANLDKLQSRGARGVLGGSGDAR